MKDSGKDGMEQELGDYQPGVIDRRPLYGPPSHSLDYRHSSTSAGQSSSALMSVSTDTEHMDLTGESLTVRACWVVLSELSFTQWGVWDISKPDHRLVAARWLAQQIEAYEQVLRRQNP